MIRPSTRRFLWALAAAGLLTAAAAMVGPVAAVRQARQLTMPPLPRTVRPSMLLTPMLALGRAPLVDYLWLRATKLKEEGRFFDAHQLSQMICELQPKFASVWAFMGWNMAYNISVTLKTPEERWRWVRNGFELIRDKGIPLNPRNTQLYKELAWILYHKVGDFQDEWHPYYKLQFALQMEDILGPPPEGFVGAGRIEGDYYRDYDYESLARAPADYDDLAKNPAVAGLAERLKKFGFDVSRPGTYLGLLSALREDRVRISGTPDHEQENRRVALKQLMDDPDTQSACTALERFWRSWRLRNEMKLDPQRIVTLQKGLGVTLDFRLPESHALYWANLGFEKGLDKRLNVDVHKLNTNRIEFYCLQKMFHRGRLAMSRNARLGEPPLLSPDLRVVPVLFDAFIRDSKEYLKKENQDKPVSTNFETGFVGFCRVAILRYAERHMRKEAQKLFDYLREHFPSKDYEGGFDAFLGLQFLGDRELNDYKSALARVEALIAQAGVHYAYDEDEQARAYLARARQVYDHYQKTVVSESQKFTFSFPRIVENVIHEMNGRMPRQAYETTCAKLNLTPLPPPQPTTATAAPA